MYVRPKLTFVSFFMFFFYAPSPQHLEKKEKEEEEEEEIKSHSKVGTLRVRQKGCFLGKVVFFITTVFNTVCHPDDRAASHKHEDRKAETQQSM